MPRTQSASSRSILAASFALYAVWGSAYLAMRVGLRTLPPLVLAGSRLLVAGLLMAGWAWSRGERPHRGEWRAIAIAAALFFVLGHGFLYWGQVRVSSGMAAVLFATIPLWMVLLEGTLPGGIGLGRRALSGLALGTLGVLLLVGPAGLLGAGRVNLAGAAAIVVASLSWSLGSLYCGRSIRLPSSAALAGGLEMLIGGALLLAVAPLVGETRGFHWVQVSPASWLAVGYLVFFSSLIGFSCYLWLLRAASPARVSTYAYITPLVAVFLGWALLGEAVTPRMLGAIALLLSAVVLIITQKGKPQTPAALESQATVAP